LAGMYAILLILGRVSNAKWILLTRNYDPHKLRVIPHNSALFENNSEERNFYWKP